MTASNRKPVLVGLFCLLVVLACFGMGIAGDFVWDDHQIVERNPVARTLNPAVHLGSEFFSRWEVEHGYYRPLVTYSLALDRLLGGSAPWLFHLTNLLLHALNGYLLFRLLSRFSSRRVAAVASALFLVHPVQSEAVLWISGRTDLLAACLLLTATLLYTGGFAGKRWRYVLFLCAVAGALLAKEMAVTFPAWLLGAGLAAALADGDRFAQAAAKAWGRFLKRGAPAMLLLIPYFGARYLVLGRFLGGAGESTGVLPNPMAAADFSTRLFTAVHVLGRYVGLLVFPRVLTIEYNTEIVPPVENHASAAFLLPAGILLVLAIGLALLMSRRPPAAFGAVAALGSYFLVSGLPFPTPALMAERVLYLPMAGIVAVVGAVLVEIVHRLAPERYQAAATGVLALLLLIPLGARTVARVPDWQDDRSLFRATVRDHPESFLAWYNLGVNQLEAGDAASALESVDRTLSFRPDYLPARLTRAAVFRRLGDPDRSLAILRAVEQDHPGHRAVRFRLVPALAARAAELEAAGDGPGAAALHQEVLTLASDALIGDEGLDGPGIKALYHMHRAESLFRLGRVTEAAEGYREAVAAARSEAAAGRSVEEGVSGVLAVVLAGSAEFLLESGSPEEAVARFREAAALSRAVGQVETAERLDLRLASGLRKLAESALTSGRSRKAVGLFDLLLSVEPGSARALFGRARARLESGDLDGAEQDLGTLVATEAGLTRRQAAAAWIDLARISRARGDLEEARLRQAKAAEIGGQPLP